MTEHDTAKADARAKERFDNFTGVMWHTIVFLLFNGFLWVLDFAKGGGLDWAFWVTIFWGIGLVFHIAWYLLSERGAQAKRYQRYLDEERSKEG